MENQIESGSPSGAATGSRDLWFCYDPGDGYEEYPTEEAARAAAEKAIDYYRDDSSSEGWSEEVWGVRYGKIHGWTIEKKRESRPPPEELDEDGVDANGTHWGEWDEICDYGISSENT